MAVIRQVKKVVHYNMDISEDELMTLLECLRYRQTYLPRPGEGNHKANTIQLIAQIKGALNNG